MSRLLEEYLETGTLRDVALVDHHLHSGKVSQFYTGGDAFSQVTDNLRRWGASWGVVSDLNRYPEPYAGNRKVEALVREQPSLLRGAVYLSANRPAGALEELEQCAKSDCFVGVKLHPEWEGRSLDDPFYTEIACAAAEYGFPVLFHTWGARDIALLHNLALRFPRTIFLAGHCGGEVPVMVEAAQIGAVLDNFYLDLTFTWPYAEITERLVNICGPHKILFGSDALWNSMDGAVGRILFAKISDSEKRRILQKNALEVYPRLADPSPPTTE